MKAFATFVYHLRKIYIDMETIETPPKPGMGRNAFTHGMITAALLILFSLLTYALDMMQNRALGFVTFILLVGGMYYGTKTYRDRYLNGFISYGKAFTSTFTIALIASVVLAVYIFLFYKFFDPDMVQVIREEAEQEMLRRDPEISDQELEMALSWTQRFTTPGWMAVFGFITNAVVSIILALIISVFLKKEDPAQQQMV